MGLFGKGLSAQNGLDFLLGGYGGLDRRRAIDTQEKYQSAIDARGDPILSAVFAANPKAAADNLSTNYGFHNIGAGDTGINGATGKISYTPRVFTNNDTVYQTAQGGGVQNIGTTDPSFSDRTARMNAEQPDYRSVGEGQTLYAIPKEGVGPQPDVTPQNYGNLPTADIVAPSLQGAIPGLRVTGLGRDLARNSQVGGVGNSMHLDNHAIDMVLPPGVTADQVVAQLRQQGIDPTEVINEPAVGDQGAHLHVGWRPKGGASVAPPRLVSGPQAIVQGAPKRTARPATVEEKAAYGIPPEVPAQMKPDGSIDVVSGVGTAQKPLPAAILKSYTDNNAAVSKIDRAIEAVKKQPKAFGFQNSIPFYSRYDANGVDPRAKVADIGSLTLHDRSGAAVTAAEFPRLAPFIPQASDPPNVVLQKLQNLRENVASENQALEQTYGPDTGYRPLAGGQSQPPAQPKAQIPRKANSGPIRVSTPQEAMALAPGTIFITPDGKRKVR